MGMRGGGAVTTGLSSLPHMIVVILLLGLVPHSQGMLPTLARTRRSFCHRSSIPKCAVGIQHDDNDGTSYISEVVGATGRMGSFWLLCDSMVNDDTVIPREALIVAEVPRGSTAGLRTRDGCPIYVATPGGAWIDIFRATPPRRRSDLVLLGNGLPDPKVFENCTISTPHYAVLDVCTTDRQPPFITTHPRSPTTIVYGRHADRVAFVLNKHGVSTSVVESFQDAYAAAALKLLWASCFWLLCHCSENFMNTPASQNENVVEKPISVGEVMESRWTLFRRLVDDLLPALDKITGKTINAGDVYSYLENYSLSIESAIPSKPLAIAEAKSRNGVFLSVRTKKEPQMLHQSILTHVAGEEVMFEVLAVQSPKGICESRDSLASKDTIEMQEIAAEQISLHSDLLGSA